MGDAPPVDERGARLGEIPVREMRCRLRVERAVARAADEREPEPAVVEKDDRDRALCFTALGRGLIGCRLLSPVSKIAR